MRAYVATTGAVFVLITFAHIWRVFEEGWGLAKDPWFLVATLLCVTLFLWAARLLWRRPAL